MNHNHSHHAPDLPDGLLIEILVSIVLECNPSVVTTQIARFGRPPKNINTKPANSDLRQVLSGYCTADVRDLHSITSATFTITTAAPAKIVISFQRPSESSGDPPQLTIFAQQEGEDSDELALKALSKAQKACLVIRPIYGDLTNDARAGQVIFEQMAALSELVNTQTRNNEAIRIALEEDFRKKTLALDENYKQRCSKADAEFEERRARYEAERLEREFALRQVDEQLNAKLEERARFLQEREKSLDLQGEREARRRLREDIHTAVTKRFEEPDLSKQSKDNFERVARACRLILEISLAALGVSLFAPFLLTQEVAPEFLPLAWSIRALAGIALVTTLTYYVRWLSSWSQQVTKNELRSKQFALDIDRASWLVEMNLEYEKEGKTLRDNLVESFSRGLFEGEERPRPREQPSDSLLHLIRNAQSLKVGAGGSELSITGPQVRKADAQAEKAT